VDETKVIFEPETVLTCDAGGGDCSLNVKPVSNPVPLKVTVWGFEERGTGLGLTEVIVTGADPTMRSTAWLATPPAVTTIG
jgi:hypothetical protein